MLLREKHFVLKFMAATQVSMLAIECGYISQGEKKDKNNFYDQAQKVNHCLAGVRKTVND